MILLSNFVFCFELSKLQQIICKTLINEKGVLDFFSKNSAGSYLIIVDPLSFPK